MAEDIFLKFDLPDIQGLSQSMVDAHIVCTDMILQSKV